MDIRKFILFVMSACFVFMAIGCGQSQPSMTRLQELPSGKKIKLISFGLAISDNALNDVLIVEFISSIDADRKGEVESELNDVFSLVKESCEKLKIQHIRVMPRYGSEKNARLSVITFSKNASGQWVSQSGTIF